LPLRPTSAHSRAWQADAVEQVGVEAQVEQLAHGIGLQVDAHAQRLELGHGFEDDAGHADLVQRERQRPCRRCRRRRSGPGHTKFALEVDAQASSGIGTSSCGPRKSSLAPWYITGTLSNFGMGGEPKACSISRPWFRKAEPSSHCGLRGRGAAQAAGSKSKASASSPRSSASYRSCNGRRTASQRCRASSRLVAIRRHRNGAQAVARDQQQPAVQAAVFQGGQAHVGVLGVQRGSASGNSRNNAV
jgi:hypothetical protein